MVDIQASNMWPVTDSLSMVNKDYFIKVPVIWLPVSILICSFQDNCFLMVFRRDIGLSVNKCFLHYLLAYLIPGVATYLINYNIIYCASYVTYQKSIYIQTALIVKTISNHCHLEQPVPRYVSPTLVPLMHLTWPLCEITDFSSRLMAAWMCSKASHDDISRLWNMPLVYKQLQPHPSRFTAISD